ncbi:DUF6292 family protein [Sciscionella marina]|nr:DUF6292 family protein [Sciscionella marina]
MKPDTDVGHAQIEQGLQAYIALPGHLTEYPHKDVALTWDQSCG